MHQISVIDLYLTQHVALFFFIFFLIILLPPTYPIRQREVKLVGMKMIAKCCALYVNVLTIANKEPHVVYLVVTKKSKKSIIKVKSMLL